MRALITPPLLIGLITLAALAGLRALDPEPLPALRARGFDIYQTLAPREPAALPVTIVAIDEESLARHGQWPWPRSLLAELLAKIHAAGPIIVGFDMLFPEADRMSPGALAAALPALPAEARAALAALPDNDAVFADALGAAPTVLSAYFGGTETGAPFRTPPTVSTGGDPLAAMPPIDGPMLQNIPRLRDRAVGQGVANVQGEADGVVRRLPLVFRNAAGVVVPSLNVEILRAAAGGPPITLHGRTSGLDALSLGPMRIPTQADGRMWLHFSPSLSARFAPAAEILDGSARPEQFRQKVVLIGLTGLGLVDVYATPSGERMFGVEILAQGLESILNATILNVGAFLHRPAAADRVEIATLLLLGLIGVVLHAAIRPQWATPVTLTLAAGALAAAWAAFHAGQLLYDPVYPVAAILLSSALAGGARFVSAEQERRRLAVDLRRKELEAQRVEGEMTAARKIQIGLAPQDFAPFEDQPAFDAYGLSEPAKEVGGDFFEMKQTEDGRLFLAVGDVAGKGLPASLFMAVSKSLSSYLGRHASSHPGAVLSTVNGELVANNPENLFVTVFAAVLDPRTGVLHFANAGHESPHVIHADGRFERIGEALGGPPLSMLDEFDYDTDTLTLEPGDTLLIVTDGVTEAETPDGAAMYGSARLDAFAADCARAGRGARRFVEDLKADVYRFTDGGEPADDLTVLVLRYRGPQDAPV